MYALRCVSVILSALLLADNSIFCVRDSQCRKLLFSPFNIWDAAGFRKLSLMSSLPPFLTSVCSCVYVDSNFMLKALLIKLYNS